MAAQKRAELGDVLMANEETIRGMKRRLGIAEEALRVKKDKERLEDAMQESMMRSTERSPYSASASRRSGSSGLMLWQLLRVLLA